MQKLTCYLSAKILLLALSWSLPSPEAWANWRTWSQHAGRTISAPSPEAACAEYMEEFIIDSQERNITANNRTQYPWFHSNFSAWYENVPTNGIHVTSLGQLGFGCGTPYYKYTFVNLITGASGENSSTDGSGPAGVIFDGNTTCNLPKVWNSQRFTCELPAKEAPVCSNPTVGHPITLSNGNKRLTETDYHGVGAAALLSFIRYYNSRDVFQMRRPLAQRINAATHPLGQHWTHNWARYISTEASATAFMHRPDGQELQFVASADGWTTDADITGKLTQLKDATGASTGWEFRLDDGAVETYDAEGRLARFANRSQPTITLTYSTSTTPVTTAPGTGYLLSISDLFGHELTFAYNTTGTLASLTDPAGNVTRYQYDTTNHLTRIDYPDATPADQTDNPYKTYLYGESTFTAGSNQPHTLTGVVDENGNRFATYQYAADGSAVSTELVGGIDKYQLSLDPSSTTVTDPLGSVYTHSFVRSQGALRSSGSSQPAGSGCAATASSMTYDANGNIASRTDFNGNLSCYAYDVNRNLETVRVEGLPPDFNCPADLAAYAPSAGDSIRKTATQWHPDFRLPIQIEAAGRRIAFSYDADGNLLQKTVTDTTTQQSRSWNYSYNNFGQVLTEDGPRTDVADITTYAYYSDSTDSHKTGDLWTITNALGHSTTFTSYDANGRLLSLTDPNGLIIGFAYDPRGRLIEKTVDGNTTRYDYDPAGNLTKITLPSGVYIAYDYDAAHRLIHITDALGGQIRYTLDAIGNRIQEDTVDADGNLVKTHRRVFDALSRLAQDVGAYNQTTLYEYDANGNPTRITDPAGYTVQSQYDTLNRLIRNTDANNGATDLYYDNLDRITEITDANNHSTYYAYNGLGDLLQQVSPNTGTTTYDYDSAGNLSQKTDAGGITANYRYDILNRLLGIDYPGEDADASFGYDGIASEQPDQLGRLTNAQRGNILTSNRYDLHGNLLRSTVTNTNTNNAAVISNIGYSYNADNQILATKLQGKRRIRQVYDAAGQIKAVRVVDVDSVNGNTNRVVANQIKHLPFGPVKSLKFGNGLIQRRSYDLDYRLTETNAGDQFNQSYNYDPRGYLASAIDNIQTGTENQYQYDALGRLALASSINAGLPTSNSIFGYDPVGNRLELNADTQTIHYDYAMDNQHLLAQAQDGVNINYGYSPQGQTIKADNRRLNYAPDQRLNNVKQSGTVLARYDYDAFGHRVKKVTESTTRYGYDQQHQLVSEFQAGNIQHTVYLEGEPLARIDGTENTSPIFYFHNNHLATPVKVSDQAGQLVWEAQLDPFGQANPINPSISQNLRFPGQYYDGETGWHYNFNRYYEPTLGRYLQSDPIGLAGGINTYAYGENNPVRYTDTLGLRSSYCQRPLGDYSGQNGGGPPFFNHQFICVTLPDGTVRCDSSNNPDNDTNPLTPVPGVPSRPDRDNEKIAQCKNIDDDAGRCFEECVLDQWAQPKPNYAIGPLGTDCQEYSHNIVAVCKARCP